MTFETQLLKIISPTFTAGSIWENGKCVMAPPTLHWIIGREVKEVEECLTKKGWKYEWI